MMFKASVWVAFATLLSCGCSKRIKESIYTPLQGEGFCFRRTNGTHEMGCTSKLGGNVGVVHLVFSESDIDWIDTKGIHDPYVAILPPKMFTHKILKRLVSTDKIAGVILLGVNASDPDLGLPSQYSDDSTCPNRPSSLYINETAINECDWNSAGSNILHESWPFPIFLVDDPTNSDFLLNDCYTQFNKPGEDNEPRDWPLCAVELSSHMYAAVDTKTCMRRNTLVNIFSPTLVCDPLGDNNVFMLLNRPTADFERYENDSVIMLSARLDAINVFERAEIGADSPSSGIVTLLAVAQLLSEADELDFSGQTKNVLFAFMNGEAFDYIGSSRLVYDMQQKEFPHQRHDADEKKVQDEEEEEDKEVPSVEWPLVDLNSLSAALELGQLYNHDFQRVFAHVDTTSHASQMVSDLKSAANIVGLTLSSASDSDEAGLPPASLHSLLKERRDLPSVLLANFNRKYDNKYYHSIYDNATLLGYKYEDGENGPLVQHLAKVAETVAGYVYTVVSGGNDRDFNANKTLVNEMLHCYTVTSKCKLFEAVRGPNLPSTSDWPEGPMPQYVGVERSRMYHSILTRRLLAFLTTTPLEGAYTSSNCTTPPDQDAYTALFIKGSSPPPWWDNEKPCNESWDCGYCINTTAWLAPAISPAFVIKDYDFSNSTYGAWTESQWKVISSRIFLKASPGLEHGHLAAGIIVLILSFCIVFWTDRYSAEIFKDTAVPASAPETAL